MQMDPGGPDERKRVSQDALSALTDRKCDCIFMMREESDEILNKGGTAGYELVLCDRLFLFRCSSKMQKGERI